MVEALEQLEAEGVVVRERYQPASGPATTLWKIRGEGVSPTVPHTGGMSAPAVATEPTPAPAPAVVLVPPPVAPTSPPPDPVVMEPPAEAKGNGHGHGDGWTNGISPSQHKAIMLLASGSSNAQAARAIGKSDATLYRWLQDPTFASELRRAADRIRGSFERRIFSLGDTAAVVVQRMLASNNPDVAESGARLVFGVAARLAGRYKEVTLQDERPPVPLVVFPPFTRMPWTQPALALPPGVHGDAVGMAFDGETDDDSDSDEV
jgi:hypothetical protein